MTRRGQKRKRGDAALEPRRRSASNSSPPPQDYDQGLAVEEMLEMVAAGQGEDTGATLQSLASISLRMIKVLQEKQEIERALVAMRMSRMQAAHSSEMRETAELLRCREEENLALRLELESLRAQLHPERAHQEQEFGWSDFSSDSRRNDDIARSRVMRTW